MLMKTNMKMTIKTKLQLGFGFLFLLVVLTGALAVLNLQKLSNASRAILKDNYETIDYARGMLERLNTSDPYRLQKGFAAFEANLKKQEGNITEPGEGALTEKLRINWEKLKGAHAGSGYDPVLVEEIRANLYALMDLNMKAIVRKNSVATVASYDAILFVSLASCCFFLIGFTFILNFPAYIAGPIKDLTLGIRQIAQRNYQERLHYERNDEFGELSESFNEMASKLDEFEHSNLARIAFEKRRIETIINTMSDLIIGLDEKDHILFANKVACELLGMKSIELLAEYAPDVALKNDLFRTLIRAQTDPVIKIFADGKESFFTRESYSVTGHDQILGRVIVLKNITHFTELDKAKTNFIATVSHELKTPISSIKLSLKLLTDSRIGTLNKEQDQLIADISDDTRRLLSITSELLDLAQVETGNLQLNVQVTEPGKIIKYAMDAITTQAQQKCIQVDVSNKSEHRLIMADPEKTAWVLVNFLSNAVRYSPARARIEVSSEVCGSSVEFTVRDFGKGIEQQYVDRIFDRFFQIPGEYEGKRQGSGLGLSISKDFIESQGGRIWVKSAIGEGSEFAFSLPMAS